MSVEWQGDHRMIGQDEKQDFERELERLGYDPSKFLVVVRSEPAVAGPDGIAPLRYKVHVTQVGTDRETVTLDGGHGEAWVAQFANRARSR